MSRLTTNKEISEMSMIELAYNSCYAKDGNARYRDYETDIDTRELTKKLLDKYVDIPNEFTCDEDFDDFMLDSLQYGTDNILGLLAIFYRNLWAMADLRERLKHYEDLEEQGKLIKLPCKMGDEIFVIPGKNIYGINIVNGHEELNRVYRQTVENYRVYRSGYMLITCGGISSVIEDLYKKTWFLTEDEAETALKAMSSEWQKVFMDGGNGADE